MAALAPKLRRELEKAIVDARTEAVKGAEEALRGLGVHEGKRGTMNEADAALRNKLRAHAKQIGDRRNSQTGAQAIDRLVQECAYAQWHRMLFARFLGDNADNPFLLEPESGVSVSLDDVKDLADELVRDRWELAAEFAAKTLPAIFRADDPLLQVKYAREKRLKLEKILEEIPSDVFGADDSLGWVYQFWQSDEKERVNKSGEKITGQTLPAVTQLFTEHYMVLFLIHNTLGAWHAGKVLSANQSLAQNAKDEQELRSAIALTEAGGYSFDYLRFVREPSGGSTEQTDDHSNLGPWRPMSGTYSGWPKTAAALKVLDPSCGSGHFLVAVFELLVRLRMHEEELTTEQAVEGVLRDNLFGMEIDPRCTQIAAFNLALAAWKFTGPKPLPPMRNIACCGIPLGNSREDWMKSLKDALPDSDLGFQWGQLYDMFSNADTLGSLINPHRFFGPGRLKDEQLDQLSSVLKKTVASDPQATVEDHELAAAAQGLTRATELLAGKYTLVITNVPYLGRGKQDKVLKDYLDAQYGLGKADLATSFVLRCLEFCHEGGSTALVTPQNWLFLTTYKMLRESLLNRRQWDFVARLGTGAFETIGGHVVNVALLGLTANQSLDDHLMSGIDVSSGKDISEKSAGLIGQQSTGVILIPQEEQVKNPDARIAVEKLSRLRLLDDFCICRLGLGTGDAPHYISLFWEMPGEIEHWRLFQMAATSSNGDGGREHVIAWDRKLKKVLWMTAEERKQAHNQDYRGREAWGKLGVAISVISHLRSTNYVGDLFDKSVAVLIPNSEALLLPIMAFAADEKFVEEVRRLDQKVMVTNATLVKVPFDLEHWQQVADKKYPFGLPEPESDDPTQWLFHGRPEQSTAPLHVAVARLLGYRWPTELDSEIRLSQRARDLVDRCSELDEFVDDDGIVCIPSVRGEDPAADRLMRLLTAAGVSNNTNLDEWLRNHLFQEHCELFHHRPFIWHVWDGRKDGFSALINYHKLAGTNGSKLLESLTYSYLGDWISRQEIDVKNGEAGAEARLVAARELQVRLVNILKGEPPFDIFVRWKALHQQPIGWQPDINDGVRINIRPFMALDLTNGRKSAGVLRWAPKIKWTKDRGKEPKRPIEEYPWFWNWDEKAQDFSGSYPFTGDRWNDCHYTNEFKLAARERQQSMSEIQE